jgi:hypothetical protein
VKTGVYWGARRVVLPALLLSAVCLRCSDDEDDALTRACRALDDHLRQCDILERGRLPCDEKLWFAPVRGERDEIGCQYECYASAACNVTQTGVCFGYSATATEADLAALSQCFLLCARQHGLECPTPNASGAVPAFALCDGQNDCSNGADEADCLSFPCGDGQMVASAALCDGTFDCSNKSDEYPCDFFTCGKGVSLPFEETCDGFPDCPDGSDEKDCNDQGAFFVNCIY